jgi:hypothetical protein
MNLNFQMQLLHKEKQCIWIPPDNICLQAKLPVHKFHPSLHWIFKRTIHAYWVKVRAYTLSLLLTNCSYNDRTIQCATDDLLRKYKKSIVYKNHDTQKWFWLEEIQALSDCVCVYIYP